MPDDFDARYDDLLRVLSKVVDLLRLHDESSWATWLDQCRIRIAAGDRHALEQLRGASGTLGSLNDLVIHPLNRHRIDQADIAEVNDRLQVMLSRTWTDVTPSRRHDSALGVWTELTDKIDT